MKDFVTDGTKLVEICEHNDIAFLGVFGSFARGESTAESDVDLLVRFSKRKSLLDLVRIEREFAEALRRTVDLLTEASISPYLQDRIKAEVKVIYERAG
jgi:predicted nucleotidyltransferase